MLADEQRLSRGQSVDWQTLERFTHWVPVALNDSEIVWRYLGQRNFESAFFCDTWADEPLQQGKVCKTPWSVLDRFDPNPNTAQVLQASAFVFHVSRCGSTLLTQLLATLPQCVALSEPPVLDAFFRLHHHQPSLATPARLVQLVHALGQQRQVQQQHLIIKLDCWHTPWMSLVRQAFPLTPIVFLYRDPAEVLASHQRQRGTQMVPGLSELAGLALDCSDLAPHDLDAYCLHILSAIVDCAHAAIDKTQAQLINYTQLPAVVWQTLLPIFEITCSAEALATLQARSQFHAKHPSQHFQGDPKIHRVPTDLETLTQQYQALEKKRQTTALLA